MYPEAHTQKIRVITVKYAVKAGDKKNNCSQSCQLIYLSEIPCLFVITELIVKQGNKTAGANTEDRNISVYAQI